MSVLNIGVVGYAGDKFDVTEARRLLDLALTRVVDEHRGVAEFRIISGLGDIGIHPIAYQAARTRGWSTRAIDCQKALKYTLCAVDSIRLIGVNRGDESTAFLQECDVIVRIGGGDQAINEAERFRGDTYQYDLPVIEE